jgi:hypothetical protein
MGVGKRLKSIAGGVAANAAFFGSAQVVGFGVSGVVAGSAAAVAEASLGGTIAVGSCFWWGQATTGLLCAGYSTTVAGAVLPVAVPVILGVAGYKLVRSKL